MVLLRVSPAYRASFSKPFRMVVDFDDFGASQWQAFVHSNDLDIIRTLKYITLSTEVWWLSPCILKCKIVYAKL